VNATVDLHSSYVSSTEWRNYKIVLETLLRPSRSLGLWWRAWEEPRPRPQCTRPRPRPIFLVSDRSCPKTDGLRPHHWLPPTGSRS